jgi:hypothetical protein
MKIDVPLKDQRTERTNDGRPPEDGNMDCVPTALAAMCQALLGGFYSGDGLHDQVYGQGYTGLQDPARYVDLLARLGLSMTRIEGAPADLVARACDAIASGHPVLLGIPSDWNDQPPTSPSAHMVAGCDVPDPNTLTAMNPWGGFYQTQPRAWWQERLAHCSYHGIWIVQKGSPTMSGIPAGWRDDGAALTAPNGHRVVRGFRYFVLTASAWAPENVPLEEERHLDSVEYHNPSLGPGSRQLFLRTALRWNNATEGVKEEDLGAELFALEARYSASQQQAMQAQSQLTAAQQQSSQLQSQLAAANQQVAQLQQQLAALKSAQAPAAQAIEALAAALASVKS